MAVFAALALPSSASAVELVNPDGTRAEPFQTWAEKSHVSVDVGTVTFLRGVHNCGKWAGQPGLEGCALTSERRIAMRGYCWNTKSRILRRNCRFNAFHELGHIDEANLDGVTRARFAEIVGVPNDWASADPIGPAGRSYLKETYADGFALCAIGKADIQTPGPFVSIAASENYREICRLIRR